MMPFFAVSFLVSVLFCGLSLDVGLLELQKTQMQTAADAAAIADEMQFERCGIKCVGDDGLLAAAQYGFVNGANNTTVTNLTNPLQGGSYNGHYDTLQVQISRSVKTLFMGSINGGYVTVAATAVVARPICESYLGTQGLQTPTVTMSSQYGSPAVSAICPVYIGGGLGANGFFWGAYQTYLTGPAGGSTGGQIQYGETFNSPVRTDPLASVVQPTVSGNCDHTNYTKGTYSRPSDSVTTPPTTALTLSPGTYCGSVVGNIVTPGMTLINVNVTFIPGLYIVTGGMNWNQTYAVGSGLTFFMTQVGATGKYGNVRITGSSKVGPDYGDFQGDFSAYSVAGSSFGVPSLASNKALPGILFFLDRAWTNPTATDFDVDSSGFNISGVLYFPKNGLTYYSGGETCKSLCGVMANTLWVSNFQRGSNAGGWSNFVGGNPFRTASVLVQ